MGARAAITVWKPRDEVYARWRELIGQEDGPLRQAPAEILAEEPSLRIGWRSSESNATGVVVFADAPTGDGTELHVDIEPEGLTARVGAAVKKATGTEPLQEAKDDLRRFKQILETGEVVVSQGTPEGHSAARHLAQRAAQPLPHSS
jgi:uncharacterized membrane protein